MTDSSEIKKHDASAEAYRQAGVDIEAADRLIDRIKPLAKSTLRAGADPSLGGFGGLFDLKPAGFSDPLLVSGTDGVGTKLKLASETGIHEGIGIDLVAMCANDVVVQGAEPLFFLDYFATGKLEPKVAETVIAGIAQGCREAGCALIGGETAEMPGIYAKGDYDLAGFCVGAVERDRLMPIETRPGDVLIGLPSTGLHANGFSLVRKLIADHRLDLTAPAPFAPDQSFGSALLEPTQLYVKPVLHLLSRFNQDAAKGIRAVSHITGGGLTDNLPRVLSKAVRPNLSEDSLGLPPLFEWLQTLGDLDNGSMRRTFNCGIGCVLVVSSEESSAVLDACCAVWPQARIIGDLVAA